MYIRIVVDLETMAYWLDIGCSLQNGGHQMISKFIGQYMELELSGNIHLVEILIEVSLEIMLGKKKTLMCRNGM